MDKGKQLVTYIDGRVFLKKSERYYGSPSEYWIRKGLNKIETIYDLIIRDIYTNEFDRYNREMDGLKGRIFVNKNRPVNSVPLSTPGISPGVVLGGHSMGPVNPPSK